MSAGLLQQCWTDMLTAIEADDRASAHEAALQLLEQASDTTEVIWTGIADRLGNPWQKAIAISVAALVIARA